MIFEFFTALRERVRLRSYVLEQSFLRPESSDWSVSLPLPPGSDLDQSWPFRVCIVSHIFNVDLGEEMLSYMSHCSIKADLIITTNTLAKQQALAEIFGGWSKGDVDIRVVPNRGRDIAPKFVACRDAKDNYDLILFLHSKKTAGMSDADQWRHWLFENLCGSPEIYKSVFQLFATYPDLGVVFPQNYPSVRPFMTWHGTFSIASALGKRIGIRLRRWRQTDFPAGSMYWVRPAALARIYDLQLTELDFPEEGGQTHYTIAHAIERLILHCCEAAGFWWLKTTSVSVVPSGPVYSVKSAGEVKAIQTERKFKVL